VLTVNSRAEFVVLHAEAYQDLMDPIETIEAVRDGLEHADRGEGRPAAYAASCSGCEAKSLKSSPSATEPEGLARGNPATAVSAMPVATRFLGASWKGWSALSVSP